MLHFVGPSSSFQDTCVYNVLMNPSQRCHVTYATMHYNDSIGTDGLLDICSSGINAYNAKSFPMSI